MWDLPLGIIATVLVSTFKSFGIETEARLIWSSGNDADAFRAAICPVCRHVGGGSAVARKRYTFRV